MKRLLTSVFAVVAFLALAAGSASAGPHEERVLRLARQAPQLIAGGSDPIPAEWAGIWSVTDSMYECTSGTFFFAFARTDTLCSGGTFTPPDTSADYSCTGSATPTTINMTCTGSEQVEPTCTANYNVTMVGTRTADSYYYVITSNVTYTGADCTGYDDACIQFNSHGVRTAPEPVAYCATPVEPTTWGKLKSRYH